MYGFISVVNFNAVELVGNVDLPRRASMHATIATFLSIARSELVLVSIWDDQAGYGVDM